MDRRSRIEAWLKAAQIVYAQVSGTLVSFSHRTFNVGFSPIRSRENILPSPLGRRAGDKGFVERSAGDEDAKKLANEQKLSIQGLRFALEHLELNPSEQEINEFLSRAPSHSEVAVVLSSNVLIAPFRAIAWALAQSSQVIVRPSSHTPLFTSMLIEQAYELKKHIKLFTPTQSAAEDVRALVTQLPSKAALHAYGSRATMDSIRQIAAIKHDLSLELHGPGFGAMIGSVEDVRTYAKEIVSDVIAFDQRGCLSPRVLLLQSNEYDALTAAQILHQAFIQWGKQIPRGHLESSEALQIRMACDAMLFQGDVFEDQHHAIAVVSLNEFQELLPAQRMLLILWDLHRQPLLDWLNKHKRFLTTLGCSPTHVENWSELFPQCRVTCFGQMQRPRFDGPVDWRSIDANQTRYC